jgi:outer membrane receptor protein involved in Fe transport
VKVEAAGFKASVVNDVSLIAGKVENIGIVLSRAGGAVPALTASASVLVEVSGPQSTEEALLLERRTADEISDNIGAREMTRGSVTNAAGAVQRIVGVTLVDDKYIFVRGLGERYSSTRLNGTMIPSTEPEKKVVPLDLFPSSLLEKISIVKSYTPDKPGEFAGGLVDLESTDFPPSPLVALSLGGSYGSLVTGKDFGTYAGGLGYFGSGGQPMPAIPTERIVRGSPITGGGFTSQQLQTIGRQFTGTWQPVQETAGWNSSYNLNLANTYGPVGVLVSASRIAPNKYQEEYEARYANSATGLFLRNAFDFKTSEESVKQAYLANIGWKIDDSNKLKLRGFLTENSTAETRSTSYFDDDTALNSRDLRVRYQDEKILAGQFGGEHYFSEVFGKGLFADWKAAYSEGKRNEDLRQNVHEETEPGIYTFASRGQSGFLQYGDLKDKIFEANLDFTLIAGSSTKPLTVKVGGALIAGDRDFSSRRFRMVPQAGNTLDFTLEPDKLFVESNIKPTGFEIAEETRNTDTYTGTNDVLAAYAMGDLLIDKFRFIAGFRVENADIKVQSFDQFDPSKKPIESNLSNTDFLPAVSVVYQAGSNSNFRGSFSQTLNRPQFRELAPFEFTEITGGRSIIGNPNLRRAEIRNYDLRYEFFPSSREVLAVSLFYKDLIDPIERTVEPTATIRTTFNNVSSARNYGAEFEARLNLGTLTPSLSAFTIISNYTYISSSVDLGEQQGILTTKERPLAGQSENVFNTTLEFAPIGTGLSLQLFYNFTGSRISDVGILGIPDIIENSRGIFDITLAQDLKFLAPGLAVKLSAGNVLDEEVLFTQGGLRQRAYKEGRRYSMSLKYSPPF